MTAEARKVDRCIVCGGAVRTCLDLGTQPLANLLLAHRDEAFEAYPLGLSACPDCSHGQLTHFLDPSVLFSNYLYASGTSSTLRSYFAWFAETMRSAIPAGSRVLEIACNDGSMLRALKAAGFDALGVDPAANLADEARAGGIRVLTGFFPETRPDGLFDAIVAMNVTAHTPDPRQFLQGVAKSLAPDGLAFIQTSQAMMLDRGEFDTVYHEHYSFFTPASMRRLAELSGLRVDALKLVDIHGGSMVSILRHQDAPALPVTFDAGPPFGLAWPSPLPKSLAIDLDASNAAISYDAFAAKASRTMDATRERVGAYQAKGGTVALVGVAAKALTFVRAAKLKPNVLIDEAKLKIGRVAPGMTGQIEPMEHVDALPDDTLFVLGAWNFADELSRKVRSQRAGKPSRFLTYFPDTHESE